MKFVYLDRRDRDFKEMPPFYVDDPDRMVQYFGYIDEQLDENNEFTIYKLIPHKILKKDVTFKFKDI